ncbi:GDSL-type esterase/lipase family protein [Streptomyces sp. CB02261]|uniref:GDSL-type esterase/lipase family protein n=1 Tax=Streptomyces sp. CB02261 TaxID=1703940 RepID=UPI00093BF4FF|nr:GDSL-type esterase/lipase family protein [Streptomyces sp. CB02261]OKJ55308.1 GDSL family lipase [Streptomyces sp. CB02261]
MGRLDPAPFLRGTAWLDGGRPVRADPADLDRLPWDIAARAALPIGVRLEFTAAPGTRAVRLRYRATVPEAGDPLAGLRHCFALWSGTRFVGETCADPATEATVTVPLPPGGGVFTLHLPEGQAPVPLALWAVGGAISPAPARPRWLVHGDSITEGWWSTRPAHSWPATAGRLLDVDAVNLGFAGGARGELVLAEHLARLPGDLITLAFGTNCWSRVPATADWMYATVRAFVGLVRQGHPDTPLLIVSPVLRPDAEHTRNALGATLTELRRAMERAGRDLAAEGDERLLVLPGRPLLGPEHLADGLHPNDTGHARIAAAVAEVLRPCVPLSRPEPSGT